jgi:hypothetical protein
MFPIESHGGAEPADALSITTRCVQTLAAVVPRGGEMLVVVVLVVVYSVDYRFFGNNVSPRAEFRYAAIMERGKRNELVKSRSPRLQLVSSHVLADEELSILVSYHRPSGFLRQRQQERESSDRERRRPILLVSHNSSAYMAPSDFLVQQVSEGG